MNRRSFFRAVGAAASALVLPYEPERVYSFGESVGRAVHPVQPDMWVRIGGKRVGLYSMPGWTRSGWLFLPGDSVVMSDGSVVLPGTVHS